MPCGITLKCKKCGNKWEVWFGLNEEESAKVKECPNCGSEENEVLPDGYFMFEC